MTCDAFDVAAVPFPFTDSPQSVKRPAMIVSRREFNRDGHSVMAMITDERNPPWPLDVRLDHVAVGLKLPSVLRMELFTLDNRMILRRIGRLSSADIEKAEESLRRRLPLTDQT